MPRVNNKKIAPTTDHPYFSCPGPTRLLIAAALLCGSAAFGVARADNTVLDWNNELLLITQQTSGNLVAGPPDVAQEIAAVGEAMSDAVNGATGSTIASFAYTGGSVANADANVAAATAAYTALMNIFADPVWQNPITSTATGATPLSTNTNLGANNSSNVNLAKNIIIPELQSFFTAQLATQGLSSPSTTCASSSSAACNGYTLGINAAIAVDNATATSPTASGAVASIINGLQANAPAGSGTPGSNPDSGTPGVYVPPANPARPEMFPTWSTVATTGITSGQLTSALATVNGPPAINTPAYAAALLQTECQGASGGFASLPASVQAACTAAGFAQSAAQAQASATAALFWNDPGTTIQPPGHWLQIADSAMLSQGTSLLQSAQLTALEGQAMNDAGIAAWEDKYAYNLWRPVTAIQDCSPGTSTSTGGSGAVGWTSDFTTCDSAWSSLIATPPHPDYLAGHPAFSGAAATVLADFFGNDNISFTSSSDYYCNGGITNVNGANQVISCTLSGTTYYICSATTNPQFDNSDLPVDCVDSSGNVTALTSANCNSVTSDGVNNGSPLICPITETYSRFSDASSGLFGAEYSRVVGGIHTPIAVIDALAVGNGIGQQVAAGAGLPDVLPEPSTLSICAVSLLALTRLRRRRSRQA